MTEEARETTRRLVLLARAQLAQTRASLCSHGVPPTHCTEEHPTTESEEA